ncbi:MAG: histidine kinase [Bacteroidetes bacterium]|nr:histidine kinase [Bacteroidota bacterium]
MKPLVIFLVACILALVTLRSVNGQHIIERLGKPDRVFTKGDGLASNSVYGCLQDYQGFMWFYSTRGISRYDGHRFKNFSINDGLPSNDIWFLSIDSLNKIWIHVYDRSLYYIENEEVKKAVDLPGTYSINLLESDQNGNIYCNDTSIRFVLMYENNNYKFVSKVSKPSIQNTQTNFYYNNNYTIEYNAFRDTAEVTLLKSKKTYTLYSAKDIHYRSPVFKNGKLILSSSIGMHLFNQDSLEMEYQYTLPNALNRVYLDNDGNIWATTREQGVYLYKKKNRSLKRLDLNTASPLSSIIPYNKSNLYADMDNNIYSFDTASFTFNYKYTIPKVRFASPFFHNDEFIITLSKPIMLENKSGKWLPYKYMEKFTGIEPSVPSRVNYYNKDTLLISRQMQRASLLCLVHDSIRELPLFVDNERFQLSFIDKDGIIYFFSKYNIYVLNRNFICNDTISYEPYFKTLSITHVNQHPQTGDIFIGTDGQGIYKISSGSIRKVSTNLTVNKFLFAKGGIVFSNDVGIYYYRLQNDTLSPRIAYTTQDGINGNDLIDFYINNDTLNAIMRNEILQIAFNPNPPKPKALLLYKAMCDSVEFTSLPLFSAPNTFENIEMYFSLFNFDYVDEIQYSYILNENTEPTLLETNYLRLKELKSGEYTITVTATNKFTGDVLARLEKKFSVKVPWYGTLLFRLLVNFVVLGAVIWLYRNRIQAKAERENKIKTLELSMKELKLNALESQMNPHFIYNSMAAIQSYIQANKKAEAEHFLTSFSKLVRQYLEASRKSFINLKDEIELLTRYLTLEKLRYEDKFEYHISIDPNIDLEHVKINTMLLQPFVENAIQHGLFHRIDHGILDLTFTKIKADLHITITDNGVGVENSKKFKQHNNSIISSRAMEIFEEKLEIVNRIKPGALQCTITNLDDNAPQYKGTVVKLIFSNVC